jgi:hypothetical protein
MRRPYVQALQIQYLDVYRTKTVKICTGLKVPPILR